MVTRAARFVNLSYEHTPSALNTTTQPSCVKPTFVLEYVHTNVSEERFMMASGAITTVVKMLETLPEGAQAQVAEHLREYIAEMQDDAEWDAQFQQTQKQLVAAAQQAKQEISAGRAKPMDYTQL
jgi:translation initiation factor 2B subunit (eIF-2B alpha/beta/delta family)